MAEKVAVIGAGIVGVAHAWREAAAGAEVTLFERSAKAEGASVRNFGMVWPIGQRPDRLETALLSRSLWEELIDGAGTWSGRRGSLHVAVREDEWRVLQEFAERAAELGYDCELLNAEATRAASPAITNPEVFGGLLSTTEIGVDPREVLAAAPAWLADTLGVRLEFETTIVETSPPSVVASDGRSWDFDRIKICSGADFQTLYPSVFAESGIGHCKLQMMRTGVQPDAWRMGPMIASGLTLRHYPTFAICDGLAALKQRIATETPELDHYGIHVMAAQNGAGEVVLGDSHEYGDDIDPFDKEEITSLMLRELRKLIDLPDWTLSARWHGVYPTRATDDIEIVHTPEPGVETFTINGGCGMTMALGLAERRVSGRVAVDTAAGVAANA